jgi:hypothetical protein
MLLLQAPVGLIPRQEPVEEERDALVKVILQAWSIPFFFCKVTEQAQNPP